MTRDESEPRVSPELDAELRALFEARAPIMDAIKRAIARGHSIAQAQRIVAAHPLWGPVHDANAPLQDAFWNVAAACAAEVDERRVFDALVVGPGALGSVLAAVLVEGGVHTALLARDATRAAALREAGLRVSGPTGRAERSIAVDVVAPGEERCACLHALVVVKARDTAGAIETLRGALAPDVEPTFVVLQNGLGRGEEVAALVGDPARVVVGTTSEGATLEGDGRVRHAGRGRTRLGPLVRGDRQALARAEAAAALLRRGGLEVEVLADVRGAIWEKLQVNAAINALTAILDVPNGRLLELPHAAAMADEAAVEVALVASALGVPGTWDGASATQRWRAVAKATAANISSTLQDVRRGRPTEVGAINAAVAREAASLGLAAPRNDELSRLITARERLGTRAPAG